MSSITDLKNIVSSRLCFLGEESKMISDINDLFSVVQNSFKGLESEYCRMKYFTSSGYFIAPLDINIGQKMVVKKGSDKEPIDVTLKMVPLRETFKLFFEKSNSFLKSIKTFMQDTMLNKTVFSNFIQGSLWQEKITKYNNKTVLPIFLYFDDYETGNPLGSHAGKNKLGAIYVSFASLPPEKHFFICIVLFISQNLIWPQSGF